MSSHPRNRHQGRYNFPKLIQICPELARFVIKNPSGDSTIDFADPPAVKMLNGALLKLFYGVQGWDIPKNYLCPPIPGRADYIHHVADLLAEFNDGKIPRGPTTRVLDVGVGANCIYPLIGQGEYEWSFVGTDVDPIALEAAKKILDANPKAAAQIELRQQTDPLHIFHGVIRKEEKFDLTICNPPFHATLEDAREGSRRKWQNLGKEGAGRQTPARNFGGQGSELVTEGGELGFVERMIQESIQFSKQVSWFTTLISKWNYLDEVYAMLERARVTDAITIEMSLGQKKSRIVTWTFK